MAALWNRLNPKSSTASSAVASTVAHASAVTAPGLQLDSFPGFLLGSLLAFVGSAWAFPVQQNVEPAASTLGDEPLNNATELPTDRGTEALLAKGDLAWADSLAAPRVGQAALERRAFDAWQSALASSEAGAGAGCVLDEIPGSLFERSAGLAERRAEGAAEGVIRRLAQIGAARRGWTERFSGGAEAAWTNARLADYESSARQLARIERVYPCTVPAALAAIACADLALEEGRRAAAAAWATRALRHLDLIAANDDGAEGIRRFKEAAERRQRASQAQAPHGRDHTVLQAAPWGAAGQPAAGRTPIRFIEKHRIVGITRSADDPFGRGLPSGLAILNSGTAVVQSALGLLMIQAEGEKGGSIVTRMRSEEALGTARARILGTRSTGGWASLPGTDGTHVAVVVGRGERPRSFMDLEVPPRGNVLGILMEGPKDRPILARWSLRDGIVIRAPAPSTGEEIGPGRLAPLGKGSPVKGWAFGLGWEFQPGPVVADGQVFAMARCLGDPTLKDADFADEVRLFALDLETAEVLWSREITSERGVGDQGRGDAGLFAATTMPLGFSRHSGTVLLGTNGGILAAYGAAEGRLLWAIRHQRTKTSDGGWPGSEAPLLVDSRRLASDRGQSRGNPDPTAWFTPLGSDFAYAMPSGPLPSPLPEDSASNPADRASPTYIPMAARPRPRRGALSISVALQRPEARGEWSLIVLGRDGRFDAALIDPPRSLRLPASYLAPAERLSGPAAFDGRRLFVPGTQDLSVLDRDAGFAISGAASIPSAGAGRGGKAMVYGRMVYVLGRDTVWVYQVD